MQTEQIGTQEEEKEYTSLTHQVLGSNSKRDLRATGVPVDMIDGVWMKVQPWINKALEFGNGEFEIGDIYTALIDREMQLWIVYERPENLIT